MGRRPLSRWIGYSVRAAAAVLIVVGIPLEAFSYERWGTLTPSAGPPPRIEWCGRRYYPGKVTLSYEALEAQEPFRAQLRQIATTPSGEPVIAAPMTDSQKASFQTSVCNMAVYVRLGGNTYQPYGLSGGP